MGIFRSGKPKKRFPFSAEPEFSEFLTKWKAYNPKNCFSLSEISVLNWEKYRKNFCIWLKSEFFMNVLSEHPLQHDRANGRMGLVTSFQAFAPVASVVVLTGFVFAASSILSKEGRF